MESTGDVNSCCSRLHQRKGTIFKMIKLGKTCRPLERAEIGRPGGWMSCPGGYGELLKRYGALLSFKYPLNSSEKNWCRFLEKRCVAKQESVPCQITFFFAFSLPLFHFFCNHSPLFPFISLLNRQGTVGTKNKYVRLKFLLKCCYAQSLAWWVVWVSAAVYSGETTL